MNLIQQFIYQLIPNPPIQTTSNPSQTFKFFTNQQIIYKLIIMLSKSIITHQIQIFTQPQISLLKTLRISSPQILSKLNSFHQYLPYIYIKIQFNPYSLFKNIFFILNILTIRPKYYSISLQTILIKNGIPYTIQSKQIRLLFIKYINKINSNTKIYHFKLNPNNGYIYLNISLTLIITQFYQIIYDKNLLQNYIQMFLSQSKYFIQSHLLHILYILEEISDQQLYQMDKSYIKIISQKKLSKCFICKCIQFSKLQYSFMQQSRISKRVEFKQKIQNQRKNFEKDMKEYDEKKRKDQKLTMKAYIQKLIDLDIQKMYEQNWIIDSEKSFKRFLNHPKSYANSINENANIFSQIYIFNSEKIKYQNIVNGKNSIIKKADIQYIYQQTKLPSQQAYQNHFKNILPTDYPNRIQKTLVFKIPITQYSKIYHQKKILKTQIAKNSSPNINKFYQTRQKTLNNSILSDFIPSKSLSYYINMNSETISLMTKIYVISHIIQGLRFLRQYEIYHLDIKTSNILVGKKLLLKICDFQQAYHPKVCKSNYHPSYTLPYTSPDVFQQNINFSQKMDVFSLGILIHQLIFECFPLESRNLSHEKIIQHYRCRGKSSMQSILNVQKSKQYGPSELMKSIEYLCGKCINQDGNSRPLLDWQLIIMRLFLNYLDKIF